VAGQQRREAPTIRFTISMYIGGIGAVGFGDRGYNIVYISNCVHSQQQRAKGGVRKRHIFVYAEVV